MITHDDHLERLLEELELRARAEIEQVEVDAQARARALRDGAAAAAAAKQAAAFTECDTEFARRRASAIADARRDARLALLHAQHAFVERVLDRARSEIAARLAAADAGQFAARFADLRTYAASGEAEISTAAAGAGGFTLVADGGHLVIDDTVDAWLDAEHAQLAIDICREAETL